MMCLCGNKDDFLNKKAGQGNLCCGFCYEKDINIITIICGIYVCTTTHVMRYDL